MKANFTYKPTPEQVYPRDEFAIERVVRIPPEEFAELIRNPLADREYVKKNKGVQFKDRNGLVHCIYVIAEGYDYGVLINCEGEDYPRYTAYLPIQVFEL